MAQSDKAKRNFEDIQNSVQETEKFIKQISKEFPDIINYSKRLVETFSDYKKLSDSQLNTLKKSNDLQKEILGNRKNIHKESFETKDLDELSAEFSKQGLGNRKKILQVLKQEQRIQKSINNQINASANAAKKFGDNITSGVQSIPFFGNFLSTALGLDNLGQEISDSLRKGMGNAQQGVFSFSSQLGGTAAEAIGGGFADSFRGKELRPGDMMDMKRFGYLLQKDMKEGKLTEKQVEEAFLDPNTFKKYQKKMKKRMQDAKLEELGMDVDEFNRRGILSRAFSFEGKGTREIRKDFSKLLSTVFLEVPRKTIGIGGGLAGKIFGASFLAVTAAIIGKKFAQGFRSLTGDNFVRSFLPGFEAFRNNFGDVSKFSVQTSINTMRMKLAFGVSAQDSLTLAKQMSIISGLSVESALAQQRSIALQARMAGVVPQDVIKDMADNHELIAKFSQDGGMNMARAAIEARKLGLSLSTTSKIADSLLSFESSIESELEASLLIGRQLNLNRARELALMGDMENLQKEIVRQVGSEQQIQNMNVIQRQKLAAAIGVEVSELQKLAQGGNISFTNDVIDKAVGMFNKSLPVLYALGGGLLARYIYLLYGSLKNLPPNITGNTLALRQNTQAQYGGRGGVPPVGRVGGGSMMALPMGGGNMLGSGGVGRLTKGGLPDMRDPVNKKLFGSVTQRNKMYGISNSSKLGGLAKSGLKTGARRFAPLAVGLGMMEFANAQTRGEKASAVGSTSGAIAGAAAGAAIGSIVPGIGTAIGGIVGGLLGEMAGRKVAEGVTSESTETQKGMLGVLEQIDRKLEKQTMAINDLGGNI